MIKKPFGGESPLNSQEGHSAFVHSGRAALRLLMASGLKNKKILLPDYLCSVVVDVMHQYHVPYDFYRVKADLTPHWAEIKTKRYDALYVINYFGQKIKIPSGLLKTKTLIIDDVFAPLLDIPQGAKTWAVFNSLRKVTPLAEGALVMASWPLDLKAIDSRPGDFTSLKYQAKQLKSEYLTKGQGTQAAYVHGLTNAEAKLDADHGIHVPCMTTLGVLPRVFAHAPQEQIVRRHQYKILDTLLRPYSLPLKPQWLSFYVLKIEQRDALKEYLAKQGIFLAAHWPMMEDLYNPLYQQVLSIALDSRYSDAQVRHVAQAIRRFLK